MRNKYRIGFYFYTDLRTDATVAGVLCVQAKGSVKGRVDMRVYETVLVQTMNASPEFWCLAESMG
jgi:hypothetical protein